MGAEQWQFLRNVPMPRASFLLAMLTTSGPMLAFCWPADQKLFSDLLLCHCNGQCGGSSDPGGRDVDSALVTCIFVGHRGWGEPRRVCGFRQI